VVPVGEFVPEHRGGPGLVAEEVDLDRQELVNLPPPQPFDVHQPIIPE
jgi:hypothetical protein